MRKKKVRGSHLYRKERDLILTGRNRLPGAWRMSLPFVFLSNNLKIMLIYFVGVLVSGLVQWLKGVMKTSSSMTLLLLAVVALVASAGYNFLMHVGLLPTVITVLTTAGAFYAFIIQRFETPSGSQPLAPVDQG